MAPDPDAREFQTQGNVRAGPQGWIAHRRQLTTAARALTGHQVPHPLSKSALTTGAGTVVMLVERMSKLRHGEVGTPADLGFEPSSEPTP